MTSPLVTPPPGVAPDLVPTMSPDAVLVGLEVDATLPDVRIGVAFGPRSKVYVYLSAPLVHVGSIVIVPPNAYDPDPQIANVVTLNPPAYRGPVKHVLAVLS
jgi:hypothetical protein